MIWKKREKKHWSHVVSMKKKSVIKNGALYFIGNIFNKAIGFITIPIFTRMMTTAEYGIVNTYNSWVLILTCVVGLSLGYTIRNAYVDYPDELGEYISSAFTLAFVNFVLIFVLTQLVLLRINLPGTLVTICLIESFSGFVVNAIIVRYVMEEKVAKRVALLIFPNLIGAVMSIFLISVIESEKYYGRIISTCMCTTAFAIFILLFYWIRYRKFFNRKYWKYALMISLPLILHAISVNILNTSDRTIITMYRGASETGIYSLIYSVGWAINVVTSSAEAIWVPKFTNALVVRDYDTINRQIKIYTYIVLFAFCGLLTVAPEMVSLMGGTEYKPGIIFIVPIIASLFTLFIYSIYAHIEFFYKKTSMLAVSTVTAALLNLGLNFIFVPKYGGMAAALTTLVSYIVSLMLHRRTAKKLDDKIAPDSLFFFPVAVFAISCIVTFLFREMIIMRWVVMIGLGAMYWAVVWRQGIMKG